MSTEFPKNSNNNRERKNDVFIEARLKEGNG